MYKFLLYKIYYFFLIILILSTSNYYYFVQPQTVYQCSQKNYNPVILSNQINQFCRQSSDCSNGATCMVSINNSEVKICCTSTIKVSCPASYTPVLDLNGQNIYCSMSNDNICTSGSKCLQSSTQPMVFLCCKSTNAPVICPNNQDALVNNGQIEICSGPQNSCSKDGYTCQYSTTINNWVCCGDSEKHLPICRNGELPYSPITGQLYTCSLASSSCPMGYICEESTIPSINVCCDESIPTTTTIPTISTTTSPYLLSCPTNWYPYRYFLGNFHFCNSVKDTSSCPFGYSCVPSNINEIFICCRLSMSFECTNKNSTLLLNNQPRLCATSLPNSCPVGFDCLPSTISDINICCKKEIELKCKNGRQIELINGYPKYCSNYGYQDTCQFGYICDHSTIENFNVCCYVL